MAGDNEREFVSKLEMLSPRERGRHPETDSMRDFWRISDRESLHELRESERHGQVIGDLQRFGEQALRPYSFIDELATESANMEVESSLRTHHVFFENQPYLETPSSSKALGTLLPATAYTDFFNGTCSREEPRPTFPFITSESHGPRYSVPVVTPAVGQKFTDLGGAHIPTNNMNRDMETLRRQLAYKCPRSSDLLMAITSTAEAVVQEHGSRSGSWPSIEDEHAQPAQDQASDKDHNNMRAAIIDHPLYSEMVVAHIRIFKVGAAKGLRTKLDDLTKRYQKLNTSERSGLGNDPALDYFMRSYVDLLTRFREDIEKPFNDFMQFKESTTRALEDICGHYVETNPDEDDDYGFDIGFMNGAPDCVNLEIVVKENPVYPADIDENIIVDPMAPDEEIKKLLRKKFGKHIGGLKAEFNRVRKKGKLPASARTILKDWFNRHSFWPYPSEAEKTFLQQLCNLNLKQVNNWFINERKRHWSCEGKCIHPDARFYGNSSYPSNPSSPGKRQMDQE